ncbi:hypothetical protein BV898_02388 [Hypsibius exemplaris]|uniref:Uncharacterized protein n=1 Tax=Hypsibius exemplaris TaxID=2072580 RepID=A0A1W0X7Y5_HYPEX|nr:hypothetical protein BV898_02388 [Hypsibius exemplaris]
MALTLDGAPLPVVVRKTVAVTGAGVAGLFALRHFTDDPNYQVVAYEQQVESAGSEIIPLDAKRIPTPQSRQTITAECIVACSEALA